MEPKTETIDFELTFSSEYWNNPPSVEIIIDGESQAKEILAKGDTVITFRKTLEFDMPHTMHIVRSGKTVQESRQLASGEWDTQSCSIKQIKIDGIDIRNMIWHNSYFEPDYDEYQTGDKIVRGECIFGFNGTWTLDFTSPFYQCVVNFVRGTA